MATKAHPKGKAQTANEVIIRFLDGLFVLSTKKRNI